MIKTKITAPEPGATPPIGQICSSCAFYFSELNKTRCRAAPPYVWMGGGGQVLGRVWPEVGPNDWCGNYKAAGQVAGQTGARR